RVKRRAYTRGPERRPILDMLMVCIDISAVTFTQRISLATIWRDLTGFIGDGSTCGSNRANEGKLREGNCDTDQPNGGGECTGPRRPGRLLAGATNRTEFPTGR